MQNGKVQEQTDDGFLKYLWGGGGGGGGAIGGLFS